MRHDALRRGSCPVAGRTTSARKAQAPAPTPTPTPTDDDDAVTHEHTPELIAHIRAIWAARAPAPAPASTPAPAPVPVPAPTALAVVQRQGRNPTRKPNLSTYEKKLWDGVKKDMEEGKSMEQIGANVTRIMADYKRQQMMMMQ